MKNLGKIYISVDTDVKNSAGIRINRVMATKEDDSEIELTELFDLGFVFGSPSVNIEKEDREGR